MAPAKKAGEVRLPKKAFDYFSEHFQEQIGNQRMANGVSLQQVQDECRNTWVNLTPEHKKMFEDNARADEARFHGEIGKTKPVAREAAKKGKKKKDPNAPKRGLSAFFCFSNEQRAIVRAKFPEFGVALVAKELGRQWSEMDDSAKAKYRAMSDRDKERYERELKEYEKRG